MTFAVTVAAAPIHVTVMNVYQTLTSIKTDSVSAMTYGAAIVAQNIKDSVTIVVFVASAHPMPIVRVVYAMLTEMSLVPVSVTLTGVMKTVASMLDSAIQNVKADVSDQPTQIVRNVSVIPTGMKITYVNVTQTGLDQTVANTWDGAMTHVSDVMDHHTMMCTLRMSASVKNVLITHIVMRTETVSVMATGAQLLTAISIADHVGRTVHSQLAIAIHADATAQLSMTVTRVSTILIAQSTDTVLVTRTGAIQLTEHATTIPVSVTTDATMDVTDQLMLTVKLA